MALNKSQQFELKEYAERFDSSVRSSDGCTSNIDDSNVEEKIRIERKIDKIKEKLTRISLAREGDVEDFLSVASNMESGSENPQLIRVRQHFEKKNKKYAQEMDHLQKKLEQLQSRLNELELGIVVEPSPRAAVLNNIRRTAPLLREMTGSVISAPRGIAHIIKNTLGSADNISTNAKYSGAGHSIFYASSTENGERHNHCLLNDRSKSDGADFADISLRGNPDNFFDIQPGPVSISMNNDSSLTHSNANLSDLKEEINTLKLQNQFLVQQLEKIQRLEEILNDTIELHQAEMTALKADLNTIGTRMDYQYCDRFCSIEENIESTQNKMIRLESNLKEWSETSAQSAFSSILLTGANVLVEFLKLLLFIISVVLDFFKPFTGTRTRAGFVILIWMFFMISSQYINYFTLLDRVKKLFFALFTSRSGFFLF